MPEWIDRMADAWPFIVTALTTAGGIGAGLWAFSDRLIGKLIDKKVTIAVERIKSDLRKNEDQLKAQLKELENHAQAVRSGAMSGIMSRQPLIEKMRVEAVVAIWQSTVDLSKFKNIIDTVSNFNLEAVSNEMKNNKELKDLMSSLMPLDKDSDLFKMKSSLKILVPSDVWDAYSTYYTVSTVIYMSYYLILKSIASHDAFDMINQVIVRSRLVAVLPEMEAEITACEFRALTKYLPEVERVLLKSIECALYAPMHDMRITEHASAVAGAALGSQDASLDRIMTVKGIEDQLAQANPPSTRRA